MRLTSLLLLQFLIQSITSTRGSEPCRINIVEKGSGWPVPLVELKTLHSIRYVSDNNGIIACDAPELMNRQVWFDVAGHGYDVPTDGFGFTGIKVTPIPGKTLQVEVQRKNIAKRLGRLTGAGIFGESQKLGLELDWKESGIFGCDSVLNAAYAGRMFWVWGDTVLPNYPFGIFHSSSATTSIRPLRRFEPPIKLQFDYFKDAKGGITGVAKMPGPGPTWLSGYTTLRDREDKERLVATYTKINPPIDAYEIGMCVWNDRSTSFDQLKVLWKKSDTNVARPTIPEGHPNFWKDSLGKEWVLFGNPFPTMRCPATYEAWTNTNTWEQLALPSDLIAADGTKVKPHSGHMAWNGYRQRWVAVFEEIFGKPSAFGEIWYTEAKAPMGPWTTPVKILTHQNYTFYNPRLHPEFTEDGSPILLFEGTYTSEFANTPVPTARHNYNQVLYRLDLNDPLLAPAQGNAN